MNSLNFKLLSITKISFELFFNLIDINREYIKNGFAGTVIRSETKEGSKILFDEWVNEELNKKSFTFLIKNLNDENLIGLINIKNIDEQIKKCEIGYFISQEFSGKGLISKFTSKVIRFCFEELEMNKIFLRIDPNNIGSQKVAQRNGFTEEGVLRQEYKGFYGDFEDVMYFGLLRNEYLKKNI